MKKLLFAIAMCVAFVGCKPTPEKVAQELITNYLKANLDDISSYEPISFGPLDTLRYEWFDEEKLAKEIEDLEEDIKEYKKIIKESYSLGIYTEWEFERKLSTAGKWEQDLFSKKKQMESKHLRGEIKALEMMHTFRSKLPILGTTKVVIKYQFDPALTKVENAIPNEE